MQDGKLTGSIQKANGRVNATIQVVHTATKVTTSFNFVGLMSGGGVLQGNFSGCEISKTAGSVAGIFKMMVRARGLCVCVCVCVLPPYGELAVLCGARGAFNSGAAGRVVAARYYPPERASLHR